MRSALTNKAHVQEGKNRFAKPDPEATLFETAEEQAARNALYHELEFFPTPPWAVRAVIEQMSLDDRLGPIRPFAEPYPATVLEPAAGRGHIAVPLAQMGYDVQACDIHDYGNGYAVRDFLDHDFGTDTFDAIITNPPFSLAADFVRKGLELAPDVLVLCRLSFLCSGGRHELHTQHLEAVYPFCERVCMALGVYDPKAKFATETAWFHFRRDTDPLSSPAIIHIPPGQRDRFFRPEDVAI